MSDFFGNVVGQTIPWFGLVHILLLFGFFLSLVLIWILGPKIKNSKYEKWIRFILIGLTILFEWKVFESRMLNGSVFRFPLCAVALYLLAFAIAFKNEKVYKIAYFYAFGTILTFLFFDTAWGLDRWNGWTYFGAHAAIGWFAVYGYRVFGFILKKKDLYLSMALLAGYTFISGYATLRFGGSDELFLFSPIADFAKFLIDIHPLLYLSILCLLAALLMYAMYLPIYLCEKNKKKKDKIGNHNLIK